MNVGELRRALEGMSDDLEVCFWNEFHYQEAECAEMKRVIACEDAGWSLGDYTLAEAHHPENKIKQVFVIE